jgi:hypothetical protein
VFPFLLNVLGRVIKLWLVYNVVVFVFLLSFPEGICCCLGLRMMFCVCTSWKQIPCGNDNKKNNSKDKDKTLYPVTALCKSQAYAADGGEDDVYRGTGVGLGVADP